MMNEAKLLVPLLAGGLLGAAFFGGLWWTVHRAIASRYLALWFGGSLVLRMVIVIAGFRLVSGSDWRGWLAALAGFGVARLLVVRLTRPPAGIVEGDHASQP